MSRLTARVLALALPFAGVALLAAPAQAAEVPVTSVTMTSEPGDYIGQGLHRLYRPGAEEVSVDGSVSGAVNVHVARTGTSDYFDLSFAAAPGELLTPGTYEQAERTPFRTAGHPGISVSGSGRGCNTVTGRFTVHEIAPDLSRLWISYEQHCEGKEAALFGEVRWNVSGEADLLVAPGRIDWPAEYPGVQARAVPVAVVNTGSTETTILDAYLTQDGVDHPVESPDFWLDNGCASLAPGDRCSLYVGFVPSATGTRTGTLTIVDNAGTRTVGLHGSGIAGHTTWDMVSEPGDWVGQGQSWSHTPQDTTITASGTPTLLRLGATTSAGSWSAELESANGAPLQAGTTYVGATRYPFNADNVPGLSVSGMGRGCNTVTGSFTVHELAFDAGQLTAASVTFSQRCGDAAPALRGSIAWHATGPARPVPTRDPAPVDTTPPAPVTALSGIPGLGSLALGWTDPADADWADTVVRGAPGLVPPAGATDGIGVYVGRAAAASVTGVAAGSAYSVTVFPRDRSGNVGPGVSLTVRGSAASLAGASAKGNATQLSGRLVDAHSGASLAGRSVQLLSRRPGGTWAVLSTLTTTATGGYALTVKPGTATEYQVRFAGAGSHFGAQSGVVSVKR